MGEARHGARPTGHPELHEHSDVRARGLVIFLIGFVVVAIVIHVGLYFLFGGFERSKRERPKAMVRSGVEEARGEAPEPRLQGIPGYHEHIPGEDLREMRERNAKILSTYGPGAEPGTVRVPIERAMEILVRQGPTTRGGDRASK